MAQESSHAFLAAEAASASPSGTDDQSKRMKSPRDSDARSDTTSSTAGGANNHRHHHRKHTGPKHHVPRVTARVPSSKALHKQGQQHHGSHANLSHNHNHARRLGSPTDSSQVHVRSQGANSSHKRAQSEVKLARNSSAPKLPKSSSQASLKRNRSHADVSKRKSLDGARVSAGSKQQHSHRPRSSKGTVQFALGDEDEDEDDDDGDDDNVEEDEWVDASGSNSPHLSRKGSVSVASSGPPSQRQSRNNSRPTTPGEQKKSDPSPPPPPERISTPDQERIQHKEYLTSRLLQRVPSSGAPPKMTAEIARATPRNTSPDSTLEGATLTHNGSNGAKEEGTSRFVNTPGSGIASEGSFYQPQGDSLSRRSNDSTPRRNSMTNFSQSHDSSNEGRHVPRTEPDGSALVPRSGRRNRGQAGETSRIQQKLNLQRQSSVVDPVQGSVGVQGSAVANPLIGVGGPGYDGGHSRDPRVSKLLERTGMEYLVVRRHQNPIVRSLNRISYLQNSHPNASMTIPRTNTGSSAGKRSIDLPQRYHNRNVSMPNPRPVTPTASIAAAAAAARRAAAGVGLNGGVSGTDGGDGDRRLSGSSTAGEDGGEDGDGTAALLRNMWEKTVELSASS